MPWMHEPLGAWRDQEIEVKYSDKKRNGVLIGYDANGILIQPKDEPAVYITFAVIVEITNAER